MLIVVGTAGGGSAFSRVLLWDSSQLQQQEWGEGQQRWSQQDVGVLSCRFGRWLKFCFGQGCALCSKGMNHKH